MFVVPNPSGLNASYPGFAHKLVWFEAARFMHRACVGAGAWMRLSPAMRRVTRTRFIMLLALHRVRVAALMYEYTHLDRLRRARAEAGGAGALAARARRSGRP